MSDRERIEPYVYQPEPAGSSLAPRLYSIGGVNGLLFSGVRLTKQHAELLVQILQDNERLRKLVADIKKYLETSLEISNAGDVIYDMIKKSEVAE